MRRAFPLLVALGCLPALANPLEEARHLFERARFSRVVSLLEPLTSKTDEALSLLGKSSFLLGDFRNAITYLERAVAANPANSHYRHWLGKAYGRRAETSSFLTAPKWANECRAAFERAVELDPTNVEAMNDLLEYYLSAPGFLGGGIDKAEALAARIAALDPIEKHYAQAKLAEKRKDYAAAERHLRRAAELAPHDVGRRLDLARFLARRGRVAESDEVLREAEALAPQRPLLWFGKAELYLEQKRNREEARGLLTKYLAAELTWKDPPRYEAERLLKRAGGA